MAKGDVQSASRKRKAPSDKVIAARVADHCACDCPPVAEGVTPINPGFFQLERMRQRQVADKKARAAKRGKVRGK